MPEYAVTAGGRTYRVHIAGEGPVLQVALDGEVLPVRIDPVVGRGQVRVTAGDLRHSAAIRRSGDEIVVTLADEQYRLRVELALPIARRARSQPSGAGALRAPIPGLVVSVDVAEGDTVEQGRPLVVMEAMKMQSELRAPVAGRVTTVHVRAGQEVMGGAVLISIAPPE